MDPREHWRAVYETKPPEEASWYQAEPEPSLAALERLRTLPSMSLIDVGAGASSLVDALLERGWSDLTLLDIADPALEATRQRLGVGAGKVAWEIADVRYWRPSRTFDIWHDRALFHFLTEPAERALYAEALRAGTHDSTLVILATFALDGPEQCSGLPVRRYDAEAMAAELSDGFALVDAWRQAHVTPWGATQSFQWGAFRRA